MVIIGTWLLGVSYAHEPSAVQRPGMAGFLGGYAFLVLSMALWSRLLARRVFDPRYHREFRRFHWISQTIRWAIPGWLAFGILGRAGWAHFVLAHTGTRYELPGLVMGTAPAMLAWVALWWAEFPAECALREQNLAAELYADLPIHPAPSFWRHFVVAIKQQLLPILLPIALICLFRDGLVMAFGKHLGNGDVTDLIMLPAAGLVWLLAPELLRRLFDAKSLEDSPLRRRLEAI